MSAFGSLKLVAVKRPQKVSPIVQKRSKLSAQLFEQMELARAVLDGKIYAPMRIRTELNKVTGETLVVEKPKRLKQWWFEAENGRVCLQLKFGTRVLDLAKGKNSIEVGTTGELLAVLQTVQTAVESGELDAPASAAVRERFKH